MANIVGAYYTEITGIYGKTFIGAYDWLRPKVTTMSDEETTTEAAEEASPAKEEPVATSAISPENSRALAQKFGLVSGEEIQHVVTPSIFAFWSMYMLGGLVFAIHLLFWWAGNFDTKDESSALVDILHMAAETAPTVTYTMLMLVVLWFNRMLNVGTSGKGFSLLLFLVALIPSLIELDDVLSALSITEKEILPTWFEYSFLMWGIGWGAFITVFTIWTQRSYTYAITTQAVILQQDFMMSRSRRRFLYSNVQEINVRQGAIGKIFNFGSVIPMTSTGLGIEESTTGVAVGASLGPTVEADDSAPTKTGKRLIKAFLAILMFQRTKRGVSQNPKHCFFGVHDPWGLETKISEATGEASESALLTKIADKLDQQATQ
jgi:membrane protein YdbS with pleckstrin-like domain